MERIAEAQAEDGQLSIDAPAGRVPDAVIGRALTAGGNSRHSVERIVAFFQKEPTGSAAASFLEKEYGTGGKGLFIGGKEYAVWFNAEGFHIAPGRSAFGPGAVTVPWVHAAARIGRLLQDGQYASQRVIDHARENEYQELAQALWFLRQDFSDAAIRQGFLPTINKEYMGSNAPESELRIAEVLRNAQARRQLVEELDQFSAAVAGNTSLLRFRPSTPLKELLQNISALDRPVTVFQAVQDFAPASGNFITEDELNQLILRGSNVSQSKLRIYSYIVQGHNTSECVRFLRDEYGIGGHSYTGFDEWHDGKGIKLSREDDFSQGNYDTVRLSWNQVEKRIRGFIQSGQYLNEKEQAFLPEYEKRHLAHMVAQFYAYHPDPDRIPYPKDTKAEEAAQAVRQMLDDPTAASRLADTMRSDFSGVPADTQGYDTMQAALRDISAFARGESPLFSPLPENTLQTERKLEQARKEKTHEKPAAGQEPASGTLAAAARALSKKQKSAEIGGEQLSLDMLLQPEPPQGPEPETGPAVSYDLGYGHAGSGLSVWNRLELADGDYKTIAHIHPNREIVFYDSNLPEEVKEQIRQVAATSEMTVSATQDTPVFSTPPQAQAESRAQWWDEYNSIKETHPDSIVLYQVGDFYEMYGEDARAAAPLLDIQIHTRNVPDIGRVEFCGVPAGTMEQYVERLRSGHDVVLAPVDEQTGERRAYPMPSIDHETRPVINRNEADAHAADYQLLSRLKADCEYFLGAGQGAVKHLWAGSVPAQIEKMRELYAGLTEKPEWLTGQDIDRYEQRMADYGREADAPYPAADARTNGPASDLNTLAEGPASQAEQPTPSEPAEISAIPVGETSEPALSPNVEEYLNLKARHPDKIIGVRVGEHLLFYGQDAEAAAPALGTKILTRNIDGLGTTAVTGSNLAWQAVLTKLLEHGVSVVLAEQDPERGPDAPYQVMKERDASDHIPIGMELMVQGRRMKVHSVNYDSGTVDLQDMELRGWYPIFRTESIPFVRQFVEDAQVKGVEMTAAAPVTSQAMEPAPEQPLPPEREPVSMDGGQLPGYTLRTTGSVNAGAFEVVFQELRTGPERHNFRITDDDLGVGGQKTKYQNNVAAIRTLKQIEAEGRLAAPEEQEILSRYVGWGSMAQAFDPDNEKWSKEYAELKELLTPKEYESARSTVLNAHYTSPLVIRAMYQAVERMGLRPGNILEPSCGIGNFFGLLPEGMQAARLYGVELDSLTGRIAKQLYQKADITVDGFENTDYPDDFFDLAVGNVPFGEYKVHDRRYDRQNLLIHDYFITKALDKVRPGGVVAFITTKGTMDKQNSKVREGFAQKADLLGAIRLPNNAFKANAGTEVTTDILFFQKRASAPEKLPDWVQIGQTEDGVPLNNYFLHHPEMVLGAMSFWRNMYGNETETACLPLEGMDLKEQLADAISHIAQPNQELLTMGGADEQDGKDEESIPADLSARNFSFVLSGGQIYFRENSRMKRMTLGKTPAARVKGMIAIRDSARKIIDLQLDGADDAALQAEQANLTRLYDSFTQKYGLLNGAGNRLAFCQDSSYPLLCSLEVLDDEGRLQRKADMFSKRTILHHEPVTSVDTAAEALAVSIGERACVDLSYMASLLGGPEKIPQVVEDLQGVIFKDPATGPFDMEGGGDGWSKGWQTADEYLSGNVREKLAQARAAAEEYPEFVRNVESLEQVQPKELTAAEIEVRVGVDWIEPKYYQQFLFELLQTPEYLRDTRIQVRYDKRTGEWNIRGKREDRRGSARVYATYGTKRRSAYQIFEDALNQRDTRVYDTNSDGTRVLNQKETTIAQQKQETICHAFKDWIFKDPARRAEICATYNRIFNSTRPREYSGDHIRFAGMNPEIKLEPHQRNAVARMLYGGNTLLAHCVGAGKTFEMTAAAMESKRLGLCQKSLFVVPNHLTEQWGGDFLTLYPGAKVLVATKKDFEPKNRKKFCARIATGDYDAVIIGHSQFEKIPLSPERQEAAIQNQLDEILESIEEAKREKEENFTIKQMEKTRKSLEARLKRLHDKKKDDVVTFEELGVDRLFVDEAHNYKNRAKRCA